MFSKICITGQLDDVSSLYDVCNLQDWKFWITIYTIIMITEFILYQYQIYNLFNMTYINI